MIDVAVLFIGSLRRDGDEVLEAHSSVTLVQSGVMRILVDTGSLEHRGDVVRALNDRGIDPIAIDTVVNTHLHFDHVSNNEIFPAARIYAHKDEMPSDRFIAVENDMDLAPGIRLMHTPGHTRGSMSVVVRSDRTYVLAGDAIPTQDNYVKWVPPRTNYDPELAMESMRRIADIADIIVPGHGAPFDTDRHLPRNV